MVVRFETVEFVTLKHSSINRMQCTLSKVISWCVEIKSQMKTVKHSNTKVSRDKNPSLLKKRLAITVYVLL